MGILSSLSVKSCPGTSQGYAFPCHPRTYTNPEKDVSLFLDGLHSQAARRAHLELTWQTSYTPLTEHLTAASSCGGVWLK